MKPAETVNAYLIQTFGVSLEDMIGTVIDGRMPARLSAAAKCSAHRLDHWRDEEGAVTELFEGVLDLGGVRYAWRASMFTDLDGERFVADLPDFKPLDWTVRLVS